MLIIIYVRNCDSVPSVCGIFFKYDNRTGSYTNIFWWILLSVLGASVSKHFVEIVCTLLIKLNFLFLLTETEINVIFYSCSIQSSTEESFASNNKNQKEFDFSLWNQYSLIFNNTSVN